MEVHAGKLSFLNKEETNYEMRWTAVFGEI